MAQHARVPAPPPIAHTSRPPHHVREMFISEIGLKHMHIVAPCPHEAMCPMAQTSKDFCRFAQRFVKMPKSIYDKAIPGVVSKYDEKVVEKEPFSYLVIRKR